jgi:iron complex outermembrane receptor protein
MKNCKIGVLAALTFMFAFAYAEDETQVNETEADEIVVVGRTIATSSMRIQVERELLVDTAAALRDIPGAGVNRNGLITGIAQYRGLYGDRVAVDIDQLGVISGGPNAMDAPLSYMSPMMTEDLVVSRGIASVSLAPETIGGHISSKTSRGKFGDESFGVTGVLGTRFSNNGNISTSVARLTLADERHRLSAIAEFDDGDDIETPEGEIRPSGLSRDRYDLSYSYADTNRNFMVYAGKLDTGSTGTPALPMDIVLIDTELFGAQFGFDVSPTLTIDGRISYNQVDHLMDNYSLREGPMPNMYRLNTASGSGAQFFLAGTLDQGESTLVFGVDGIAADHESVITNPENAMFQVDNFIAVERELLGVFAEWTRNVYKGEVELGLRFKRVDTNAGDVAAMGMMGMVADNVDQLAADFNAADRDLSWDTFDAVAKYRRALSESAEWSFEIGSKSRAPSYQELYLWLPLQATGGLADGKTYIGNLGLKEERSNEVVFGVSAEIGRFAFSPQVFYRRMVAMMMTGSAPLQFANVDAEIWGFDAAWRYELTERLLLDGTISVARGSRRDVDDELYRLSPFNGGVGLTYSADQWSLKSELVGFADQKNVSSYNDESETSGYWLVNLGFAWNPMSSLRVEARVDNLLDESYQDHVTGINRAGGSDIPVGTRLFGAQRTLSAGLIYSF